jgi:uncharacterized protein YdgA (DUF945 family)
MKKLAGLVIILAALILGGYYGMGVLTEKTIRKNIEVIDQSSNGVRAEIQQYDRNFFSSNANIKWNLHIPQRVITNANGMSQTVPAQDYVMNTPLKIYHGPIIFTNYKVRFGLGYAESVFPFPPEYETEFNSTFSSQSIKPQLDLSIFVNYLKQSTLNSEIPAFKLVSKVGNGHFDWLGLNSTTTVSSEMKRISGTITFEGAHISKDDVTADLGKVLTDYDLHETLSGLYLGDASFKLPLFTITANSKKLFSINALNIKSGSDIKRRLFSTDFMLTIKSFFANSQNYGPGKLEMALRNIDADVLARINQQTTAIQNGTEAERQQAIIALLPEVPKLFSKGAEFEISRLSLVIPEGTIEGNLFVSLPKGDNANPFELMQKIHGNAKLKVPMAAVKKLMQNSVIQQIANQPDLKQRLQASQAPTTQPNQIPPTTEQLASTQADKQLSQLQQNGLITVQGTDYFVDLTLDQGKFTVNGKPFDSSMLKF